MARNDGITGITLSTNIPGQEPVTVSPEKFDRYVDSLKRGARTMPTATAALPTVRVPDADDFGGADYIPDPALDTLFSIVTSSYNRLRHIEDHGISVSVLWKRKGGKSKGTMTFAKCQKPSGLLAHFCTADFVIWIGADNVTEAEWNTDQLSRLLYHEARHIGWDDGDDEHDPKAIILGHDVELFAGEVADTGAWEHFRGVVGKDFSQMPLI